MTRLALVPALLAVLLTAPLACSRFGEAGDTPDAGDPADTATVDAGGGNVERRIYVFGGMTAVPAPVPKTDAYFSTVAANGELSDWTKVPALGDNCFAAAWARVGDLQLAAGGNVKAKADSVEGRRALLPHGAGDPAAMWTETAPLGMGRSNAAALARGTSVYVSGGTIGAGPLPNIERYDTTNDTWSAAGSLNGSFAGHAAVLRNSLMYIVGGDRGGTLGATVGVAKAPFTAEQNVGAFESGGDLTFPLAYHAVALVEPWLFTIGGANSAGAVGKVARGTFDGSGVLKWSTIGPLPLAGGQNGLAEACAVVVDRTIYLMGGRDDPKQPSKGDVYIGRVDPGGIVNWKKGPSFPEGRSSFGCAVSPSSAP